MRTSAPIRSGNFRVCRRRSGRAVFWRTVSNTLVTASRAAEAIHAHWAIETTTHYSRDVTMGEDRSRIRSNPGAASC